ncbi:hypothetical protein I305_04979 [Cryptococcus gattii E566]|uniref:Amidohydrolase-related domain-containing protein n=2 Tax=Cryptococcus gattii TaxID=37769 RepID=E6RBX8_CRYGW|nr:Hypothetical Protein CGB_I1510C [Cryptococcus gattii WM276]ADV24297.1 Hypothetical Protein CGB_I1510C [Cryptococcus gattii WM276]KIR76316.1 hypothetical protein I306_06651 [Cryptococcus gattii EJB2]KIY32411.1 hypothetical protein I305_04979 [Cryptococcus gattii E566]KJE02516.1 hypothetical protein I311_03704 [Cryptococcus gattii NT-10]
MPPKRPPPLPRSLFTGQGPLAPGNAPLPLPPTRIHPDYIVDSHSFVTSSELTPDPIYHGLAEEYPRPPVRNAVQVKMNISAEPAQAILGVKPFSIHPTVLNLGLATPPSVTNIAKGAVDIIVPSTVPLTEKDWDLLDEAVIALEGCWGHGEEGKPKPGKIVISGLLVPPLTKPSSALIHSESFNLHLARLASLSLHANVFLKVLPPVAEVFGTGPDDKWWTDRKELERVLRMYASHAIETFGTHRLIFGSSPALPLSDLEHVSHTHTVGELEQPISNGEWYAVLRKCVAELGEGVEEMTGVMGANAAAVYDLHP